MMSRTVTILTTVAVALLAGVCLMNTGDTAGQDSADDPGHPRPPEAQRPALELFETTWPNRAVRNFYNTHGIKPIPLYTQWYCCDRKEQ